MKVREIFQAADEHTEELTSNYGVTIEQVDCLKADSARFAEINGQLRADQIAPVQATSERWKVFLQRCTSC